MTKKMLFLLLVASMCTVFTVSAIHAGANPPDEIILDTPGIKGDKYFEAKFTHKKHSDLGYKCSECHHDDKGKAIEGLKAGDAVQKCIECHSNLSMGKEDKKKKDSYYFAFHGKGQESCKGCHRAYNTKKKLKKGMEGYAPNGCNDCHKAKKKKKKK